MTRPARVARHTALLGVAAALITACGGGSGSSGTGSTDPAPQQSTGTGGFAAGGTGFGAFGVAAAVNGSTIEVQNDQSGQTAVTFTGSTTFRQTVTVARSVLKVGDCVTVRPTASTSSTTADASAVTADTVSITGTAGSSGCTRQGGGNLPGGGNFAGGTGGGFTPPSLPPGFPSTRPSAFPGGGRAGGIGAFGEVTAIATNTFTVKSTRPTSASGSTTTTDVTVTTPGSTVYEHTVGASSKALKVGLCVAAVGPSDSTGTVKARSITLSTAGKNGCTSGFAGGGFGGPPGGLGNGTGG